MMLKMKSDHFVKFVARYVSNDKPKEERNKERRREVKKYDEEKKTVTK